MDSVSQIVLGAAVSNAFLGKKIGNRSIFYGALIGTIPDLDVWISKFFYDPISQIEIHRGFSHSILFYLLLSFLLAFLIFKKEKKFHLTYKESFWTVFLVLFTHSVLDIFTTWGTNLFWPFFGKLAIKSIFVIDPLYTIPFLICLIISIRKNKKDPKRYFWNRLGLILSSSYLLITVIIQFAVTRNVESFLKAQNINYSNLVVKPTAMNTILWNIIIETDDAFLLSDFSFFDSKEIKLTKHLKNQDLIKPLENHEIIKQLKRISENQFIITQKDNDLFFNDLRFGIMNNSSDQIKYAFSYELYQDDGVWKAKELTKEKREGIQLLKELWIRLQGN